MPGCRSILRLDKPLFLKRVAKEGKLSSYETRYFVSSLDSDVVPASEFQELIRRHWEVENCLHWQKDRYFEEDKRIPSGGTSGQAWTMLANIAVSLTRLLRWGERTLREINEKCFADPRPTAKRHGLKK